jgi:hypothetical protein
MLFVSFEHIECAHANAFAEKFEPEAKWGSADVPKSKSTKPSGTSPPRKQVLSATKTCKLFSHYVLFCKSQEFWESIFDPVLISRKTYFLLMWRLLNSIISTFPMK